MRSRALVCFLVLFSAFLNGQSAAPNPGAAASSIPRQTLAASAASLGAADGQTPAISANGVITTLDSGEKGSFKLFAREARVFRTETSVGSNTDVFVINQDSGYYLHNGKRRKLGLHNTLGQICPYVPLFALIEAQNTSKVAAEDGAPATKAPTGSSLVKLSRADADDDFLRDFSQNTIEVDSASLQPKSLKQTIADPGNPQFRTSVEYVYGDYRAEGKYLLPHSIEARMEGKAVARVTFDSITVDAPLDASLFDTAEVK